MFKVIVDTLSPWDKNLLVDGLKLFNLTPEDITHLGNLSLYD